MPCHGQEPTPPDRTTQQTPLSPPSTAALLLRGEDVCDLLNLSRATVQRLLASGVLPSVKVGRARRVVYTDLEKFVGDLAEGRLSIDGCVAKGGAR